MKERSHTRWKRFVIAACLILLWIPTAFADGNYPIVDTGQTSCYDNNEEINPPSAGQPFYGQDAQIDGIQPSYTISADELTVYDNITGLTWTRSPDTDRDGDIDTYDKLMYSETQDYADQLNAENFGGFNDWRLPSIKELYSLMNFNGTDPSGPNPVDPIPFIDTTYFDFGYGDLNAGERLIDAQFWSSNECLDDVFDGQPAAFGLNLADGRIKGYPTGQPMFTPRYVYYVRGNVDYGSNDFADNGDGTISDNATGLMWTQNDHGGDGNGPRSGVLWEDALAYVQQMNSEEYLGYDDWRLPNAKELQSIVDYDRAPGATGSAALDPLFNPTQITNEEGETDWPWYWSSTTHIKSNGMGDHGVYVCFGRGMGYMMNEWMDVHSAGCQRSDVKDGDFTGYTYFPDGYYFGNAPQGDASRSYNYVMLVRDATEPASLELHGLNTTVGPDGGTVTYSAQLTTNVNQGFNGVDYWTMVTTPSGMTLGPIIQQSLNLPPFAELSENLQLTVPSWAPAGDYTYEGFVGYYPVDFLNDAFEFLKTSTSREASSAFDWEDSGWPSDLVATAGESDNADLLPTSFVVSCAYPNPFNPTVVVPVSLPQGGEVTISLINALGQTVHSENAIYAAGQHQVELDASGNASGVYLLRVTYANLTAQQKVVLMK